MSMVFMFEKKNLNDGSKLSCSGLFSFLGDVQCGGLVSDNFLGESIQTCNIF